MNYRSVWVKWAVYVWIFVCVADTEEAWQTCPLSADGGMHNSIWRQFHAVSLPLSSLFPKTDKVGFGYRGEARATSCLPSLAQQLSARPPPPSPHTHAECVCVCVVMVSAHVQRPTQGLHSCFTHKLHCPLTQKQHCFISLLFPPFNKGLTWQEKRLCVIQGQCLYVRSSPL